MANRRLVPLIVACPMFLQNIDMSAMAIALPSIAQALHTPVLQLNLVITAYLLSLAVFLPMSAWLADRFGAKTMFCVSIALFSMASAMCGMATSTTALVFCRMLQGFGAALMVPVGRLILLRSVPPTELIAAMVWYTVPPAIGRLAGPLVGGAIVSIASWKWIFFVNIPFGLLAVGLAVLFIEDVRPDLPPQRFDFPGFLLMGTGLAATLGGLETAGKGLAPNWVSLSAVAVGAVLLVAYGLISWRQAHPVIDLKILRLKTFRTNILGAAPLRLTLSAVPFLIPLMLQIGFGLSPLVAGSIAAGSALGGLCTRAVMRPALKRFSFRQLLLTATLLTGVLFTGYALFRPTTPHAVIFAAMFFGGLLSSLCMVSLNTLGFVDLPNDRVSHATALTAMAQQLLAGIGIVLAASLLGFFSWRHGGDGVHLIGQDFALSIAVAGPLALLSLISFWRLDPKEGNAMR